MATAAVPQDEATTPTSLANAAASQIGSVAVWAAARSLWVVCVASCLWLMAYILLRSTQPYPLDAFEEYQLLKAVHWAEGGGLYGSPASEPLPEAYPPLYFGLLGLWTRVFSLGFLSQRLVSLLALIGIVVCGWMSLSRSAALSLECGASSASSGVARLVFITALLGFHAATGKSYEVGKPDTVLTFFVALAALAGAHRSWREVLVSSAAVWLAGMTKQNGPLFLAPLCLAHVLNGRWRWAVGWGAAMSVMIGGAYLIINSVTRGNFYHWVFVWTAGHGVDWGAGTETTARAVLKRGPMLIAILSGSLWLRPRCRWTWCLAAALGIAWMGMSKAGGRENHLLPAAVFGAILLGRWAGAAWSAAENATPGTRYSGLGTRDCVFRTHDSELRTWCIAVRTWLSVLATRYLGLSTQNPAVRRWGVLAAVAIVLYPGFPTRRDFRWLDRRAEEVSEWTAAVRDLPGRVAVSHHKLLADRAGAECFFSDLILEFPGLVVPAVVCDRIRSREFDYLVLTDDPETSPTAVWATWIAENYRSAGLLDFASCSDLLPRRLYARQGLVVPDPGQAKRPEAGRVAR